MTMRPSKGVITDVNVHTNSETLVTHKIFTTMSDEMYGVLKFGTTLSVYFDSTKAIEAAIFELRDMAKKFDEAK